MHMKGLIALSIVAGTVLASGYWLGRTLNNVPLEASAKAPSMPAGPNGDDSRVIQAIARMEERLELLEARSNQPRQDSLGPAASSAGRSESAAPPSLEDMHQRAEEQEAAIGSEIERRFATETRDRTWASAAEDQLRQAVAATAVDGKIITVSCLTSLCKLEFSATAMAKGVATANNLPFHVEGIAGFRRKMPEQQPDGTYKVAFDFYRKGYPTPLETAAD
jgi:hypothetical protein